MSVSLSNDAIIVPIIIIIIIRCVSCDSFTTVAGDGNSKRVYISLKSKGEKRNDTGHACINRNTRP